VKRNIFLRIYIRLRDIFNVRFGTKIERNRRRRLYKSILHENFKGGVNTFTAEIEYLRQAGTLEVFPYPFSEKYKGEIEWVGNDDKGIFTYTMNEENVKKLYFPDGSPDGWVAKKYRSLRVEQDAESPHRYYTKEYYPNADDILIDVGAAEGKEALAVADIVKEIYLFECDYKWREALRKSFGDYSDKTTIYSCYAGNVDDEKRNVRRLDTVFAGMKGKSLFIKMDVEGMEMQVLQGAQELIKNNSVRILCTTYHKQGDEKKLGEFFTNNGFKWEFSEKYMLFYKDKHIKPPYFRHGLIRATKD
jgi:hypothetical protein